MKDVTSQEFLSQRENAIRPWVLLQAVVQLQRQKNEWKTIFQVHPAGQEMCQSQAWVARPGHMEF